ncbi:hypothetical protein [Calidifontibacter terrae]
MDGTVDIARVPVYPVVRLELRDEGEQFTGLADGAPVGSGPDEGPVRDALIAHAAGVAANRPGVQAVRAIGTWGEGHYEMVVTGDGTVLDQTATEPGRGQQGRRRKWLPLALAGGVAIPALVAAVVTISSAPAETRAATTSAAAPTRATPTPTQLPVQAPSGWSAVATWSTQTADLSSGLTPAVAGDTVVVPTGDGSRVSGVNAITGGTVWTAKTGDPVSAGVTMSLLDGHPVAVATTSTSVFAWDPRSGAQRGKWALPSDGAVRVTPSGVVIQGPGPHASIATGKGLQGRVLPAGASAVGVSGTRLLVAGSQGVWTVSSDRVAGNPKPLPATKGLSWRGVVGQTSRGFVAAYGATDGTQVELHLVDFTGKTVWASKPVPTDEGGDPAQPALRVAPSGTYGVYGTSVVDLTSGAAHALPASWQTTGLGSVVYGVTEAGTAWVDPATGSVHTAAAADGTEPVGPVGDAGGLALICTADGHQPMLYAVAREGGGAR